ncbi:RNA-binding protein with serine-rich domain 1-like isoform X1 [Nerophis ophidion]|uniref:RNA-binding protein with serine-rich domain 1-like isoform X1 n=1 Tax=Nerophis ophidion TaxID=159077 RepID=UPI002ADF2919|nr:RNA-binding protein with serine-rich domain 1-like isoform X1 [Nerophis ophidion]XP_061765012.1 RNA-binding protein with serine-rich domain 1-like isoform X1 [Nerophis ophidion]
METFSRAPSPTKKKEDDRSKQRGQQKAGVLKDVVDKERNRGTNRTRPGASSRSSSSSSSGSSSISSSGSSSNSGSSSSSSSSSSPSPSRQRQNKQRSCSKSKSTRKDDRERRKRSPTPKPTKVYLGRLTRNVIKEHLQEIFSTYGKIKRIDMPMNRIHPHLSKGFAYIEFENPEEAEQALKYMDGGQIDGQEITVIAVLTPRARTPARRLSPPRRMPPPPQLWRRTPPRMRRRSPRRRSPVRRRSRSPGRRRHRSRSSSNSSR